MSLKRVDFAEFYASSRNDCLRVVLAVTGDRAAAEDLVAEAFARAWASWRTVGAHPAPRAWVVRTALNLRVSSWRRHRREVALGDEDASRVAARAADRSGISPVDPEIMAALADLPERQRQVIALRIFVDMDTAGTAQALGIAPGTVTAHLARARRNTDQPLVAYENKARPRVRPGRSRAADRSAHRPATSAAQR